MDLLTTIAVVVPSTLSLVTSLIYAYIALKKLNTPKDEIWETVIRLLPDEPSEMGKGDDFADLYEQLKFFKENGCSLKGSNSLTYALTEKRKREQTQQSE